MPTVTTWYLEQTSPSDLKPALPRRPNAAVALVSPIMPELNRFFYTAVGGDWYWTDRLGWSYADWLRWLDRPQVETWVVHLGGVPAGYFELEAQPEGNIEISYFGLLPAFVGQGLGGYALSAAAQRGWERGARRVWVHTCSLDHPAALANYLARGFRVYHQEDRERTLPPAPPGPWPNARGPRGRTP